MYIIVLDYEAGRTIVRKLPDNMEHVSESIEQWIQNELGVPISGANYMSVSRLIIDIDVPDVIQEIDLL